MTEPIDLNALSRQIEERQDEIIEAFTQVLLTRGVPEAKLQGFEIVLDSTEQSQNALQNEFATILAEIHPDMGNVLVETVGLGFDPGTQGWFLPPICCKPLDMDKGYGIACWWCPPPKTVGGDTGVIDPAPPDNIEQ